MNEKKVLISGGGIAGLSLGIQLKKNGWEPLIVEKDPKMRTEGYMMDFFGSGWDTAERMGILDDIKKIHYPIDNLEYVKDDGSSRFKKVPIDRVRRALNGRYTFLRRSDLEKILYDRAKKDDVNIRFGTTIQAISQNENETNVTLNDGTHHTFALVFGADGIHSKVRELILGPEQQFDRFLGYYVAAFHLEKHNYDFDRSFKIYEEDGRLAGFYPLDEHRVDATYVFRHDDIGHVPHEKRLELIKNEYKGAGWIAEKVLRDFAASEPIFFDVVTQIVTPTWHKGRIALIGDACGCLTLLAGQGSHMAMAGAYIVANELKKHEGNYEKAFTAYEKFLKPLVEKKQKEAMRLARIFVPSKKSRFWFRTFVMKLIFSKILMSKTFAFFGARSIFEKYKQ